jgi:hypothetical protein
MAVISHSLFHGGMCDIPFLPLLNRFKTKSVNSIVGYSYEAAKFWHDGRRRHHRYRFRDFTQPQFAWNKNRGISGQEPRAAITLVGLLNYTAIDWVPARQPLRYNAACFKIGLKYTSMGQIATSVAAGNDECRRRLWLEFRPKADWPAS